MATKLFKRTDHKDVFETVLEDDDDASIVADTGKDDEPTASEAVEAAEPVEPGLIDDDADAPSGEAEDPPAPSRRRRRMRYLLDGVVTLIFLAVLALSGFLGWQVKQQNDIHNASRAAMATAQSYAVTLTSIDTNKVDENFDQVLDGATGEFKDMYSQSASQLRRVLIDNKAMSKGIVVDSAIKSATKTKVEVLIFIDQSITNKVNPEPRIDRSRVAMTMELVDGRWLASKVDIK